MSSDEDVEMESSAEIEELEEESSVEYADSMGSEEEPWLEEEEMPTLQRAKSYHILSPADVKTRSKTLISETKAILCLSSDAAAAALLRKFGWNKEKLIGAYSENPEKTLSLAGMGTLVLEAIPKEPKTTIECKICLDDVKAEETFALGCGHRYCKTCWADYLTVAVQSGPTCIYTECIAPDCTELVHEEAFKKIIPAKTFTVYQKYLNRSFVDDNPSVKWCPAPGCKFAVYASRRSRREPVTCGCGFQFCFRCSDYERGGHVPVTCELLEKWEEKNASESENVQWLIANTKKCPKCRSPIEKNGGCMHMTCRKEAGGCGFEFCWLCRGDWVQHGEHTGGYYKCNKYQDAEVAKKEDVDAAAAKTLLDQYMWYYHRYEAHREALNIADKQKREAAEKSAEMQRLYQVRPQDAKFLEEATDQLIANRRVLMFSYVYGYWNADSKEKKELNLFTFLQENLEKNTNYLSELYEKKTEDIPDYHAFMKWKEEVTNFTRVYTQVFGQLRFWCNGRSHSRQTILEK